MLPWSQSLLQGRASGCTPSCSSHARPSSFMPMPSHCNEKERKAQHLWPHLHIRSAGPMAADCALSHSIESILLCADASHLQHPPMPEDGCSCRSAQIEPLAAGWAAFHPSRSCPQQPASCYALQATSGTPGLKPCDCKGIINVDAAPRLMWSGAAAFPG